VLLGELREWLGDMVQVWILTWRLFQSSCCFDVVLCKGWILIMASIYVARMTTKSGTRQVNASFLGEEPWSRSVIWRGGTS
jgi:hypothetical protein